MFFACSLPGRGGSAAARSWIRAITSGARPCRISRPQAVTQSSAAWSRAGWKHQAAFRRYSMTWMKSIRIVTSTSRAAASAVITSIWWLAPSASAIQVRAWPGSRRSAWPNRAAIVSAQLVVMSAMYHRFTARGLSGAGWPGARPMICSGVLGSSGDRTSKTTPVSAIRLHPDFWPVPSRRANACPGRPAALRAVSGRRASGRTATPLPSGEITSGGRSFSPSAAARPAGRQPGPGPGRTAPRPRPPPW